MWGSFSKEIATTSDVTNFSMLSSDQHLTMKAFLDSILDADNLSEQMLFDASGIQHAINILPEATSPHFFEELAFALFRAYSVKGSEHIERIVQAALDRHSDVFPIKTKDYFEFKNHQQILNDISGKQDDLASLYSTISEMEQLGLDTKSFSDRLVRELVLGGEFQKAIPLLDKALKEAVAELNASDGVISLGCCKVLSAATHLS